MASRFRIAWVRSASFDIAWILGPPFWATLLVFLLPTTLRNASETPVWMWLALVLGIDVAHVYSTLFRTYFDPDERARYRSHLIIIPILAWVAGVLLYSTSAALFWTVLAYLAVFHFIRQQYGLLRIYTRHDKTTLRAQRIEAALLYLTMLFPLVAWHATLPRNFEWFIEGDFLGGLGRSFVPVVSLLYGGAALYFIVNEYQALRRGAPINLAKYLVILGTALAWYVGIVAFNADIPFTITNVIAHGVPYVALVWAYQRAKPPTTSAGLFTSPLAVPIFLLSLWFLGYFEETLWHGLVWQEQRPIFGWAIDLFAPLRWPELLPILVPLLAVPQATHYVLDAFIWKVRRPDPGFAELLKHAPKVAQ